MKILITGGASGLGEAITRRLAADTANEVFFTYNGSLEQAKKMEADFANAVSIKCNFKNAEEVAALKAKIADASIDVLVNNAYSGSFIDAYFHKTESSKFLEEFTANILPTIDITQAAINAFRKKKQGKIITILTSALLNTPPVGASAYVANKAYLQQLTKVWAVENARFNITSNSVSPAFMLTNFTTGMDERLVDQIKESHPLKRLLDPDEVAQTVQFLCSAGAHLNGADIVLNSAAALR